MNEISRKILDILNQKEISYGVLADLTGIPKSALQRYATGETEKIPIDRLQKIAQSIGTSVEYLMGWENHPAIKNEAAAQECDSLRKEVIDLYDSLSDPGKDRAVSYLRFLSDGEKK